MKAKGKEVVRRYQKSYGGKGRGKGGRIVGKKSLEVW